MLILLYCILDFLYGFKSDLKLFSFSNFFKLYQHILRCIIMVVLPHKLYCNVKNPPGFKCFSTIFTMSTWFF